MTKLVWHRHSCRCLLVQDSSVSAGTSAKCHLLNNREGEIGGPSLIFWFIVEGWGDLCGARAWIKQRNDAYCSCLRRRCARGNGASWKGRGSGRRSIRFL